MNPKISILQQSMYLILNIFGQGSGLPNQDSVLNDLFLNPIYISLITLLRICMHALPKDTQ